MIALYIIIGFIFIFVFAITTILLIPRIIYGKLKYNKGQKCDCIIILGCRVPDNGEPSSILIERIKKGIELYRLNIAPKIICSGGAVRNEHIEAEIIFNELIKTGVPREDIICEKDSDSTWGNIKYSKIIMGNCGLKSAVIVSTPEHLRKASIYATKMEMDYTVEKSNIPQKLLPLFWIAYIYVYYGIIKYLYKHK